ncbi:MAG: DUF2849 domain-containing protein [Maricaulaceae bacterium]|jgi:hypothetical protein
MSSVRPNLKPDTPKAVTSWDVRTGRVVYWTEDGQWSHDIGDAAVLTGDDAEAALAEAKRQETLILDPYFMQVAPDGGVDGRETTRETIRAQGPTSRRDLGRQAGNP